MHHAAFLAEHAAEWLLQRARVLQAEIAAARASEPVAATREVIDLKDEADDRAAAVVHDFGLERDLAELREVEAAGRRLAAGVYGLCEDCEAEIEPARLRAQPTARRCRECQERAEHRAG